MIPAGAALWRLSEGGEGSLGLSCRDDGLFLGRTPLVRREVGGFVPREQAELEHLLTAAYGFEVSLDGRMGGLKAVAKALNAHDRCLAGIAAVLLRLPDLPGLKARALIEAEDRQLDRSRAGLRLMAKWDAVARGPYALARSMEPRSFDPAKHPRWPAGRPDGGEFRPASGGGGSSPVRLVSSESEKPGIGHNQGPPLEEPPKIPPTPPPTTRARNAFLRQAAEWLRRAAQRASQAGGGNARARLAALAFVAALEATAWAVESLPKVLSYLDRPKSLQELQEAVDDPEPGYQNHHIVETQYESTNPKANSEVFTDGRLEARANVVRIPYWKHVQISSWYSTPNARYGGLSPRSYLRGKSWGEQYEFGLDVLRKFGVLK